MTNHVILSNSSVILSEAKDLLLTRAAICRLATAYARGELVPADARAFEDRFRSDWDFRHAATVKLLGCDPTPMEEVAFAASHPYVAQFNLRRAMWRASPFRMVFPTFDAGSMRMAGDEERPPKLDESDLKARRDSRLDEWTRWSAGRYYEFTYEELSGTEAKFSTVRDAIRDGADRYYLRSLTRGEALCFEQWFIYSRDFRKFVIPYLATAERRVYTSAYEAAERWGESRWDGHAKAGMGQFKFERSTSRELAAAERLWAPVLRRLGLALVDLRSGALLPDERALWAAAA